MDAKDLDKMTLQDACDYSVKKIVEQGGMCMDGCRVAPGCVYENSKGMHCAIGWLLDSSNSDLMEAEGGLSALIEVHKSQLPGLITDPDNEGAFSILQVFHDVPSKDERQAQFNRLSEHINTTAPQYQQWVEMGI